MGVWGGKGLGAVSLHTLLFLGFRGMEQETGRCGE